MTEMAFPPGVSTSPSAPRYSLNERIDLCRGIFAFLVVSAHAMEMARALDPAGSRALRPWFHDFLTYVTGTGLYYVMGFFVISGYCIQLSAARCARRFFPPQDLHDGPADANPSPVLPGFAGHGDDRACRRGHPGPCLAQRSQPLGRLRPDSGDPEFHPDLRLVAPSWSITNEVVYYVMFGVLAALLREPTSGPRLWAWSCASPWVP